MSCVNINSKEFKKLVEDTGISAGNLELIIHDYQNNQGNEGEYPSIEYIMNKLTGTNEVISDAQVELWEKKYSTPKVFKDKQNLEAAVSEASRYYSKEAITTWEDNEGNYVMKVAEPQLTGEAVEREYERILANAPRDKEGRLLAPNGRPSNLNERQYAQVRSKAFKRWFGDWESDPENASKVVDENGEPLVVYHESPYLFNEFDTTKKRFNVHDVYGIWTSTEDRKGRGYGKYSYPLFVNIKNPNYTNRENVQTFNELRELENKALKDPNSDGTIIDTFDKFGFEKQIFAKNANQVKSAENVGTFETREDNIYHDNLPTSYKDSIDNTLWNLFESNKDKENITIEAEASIVDIIDRIKDSEYSSIIELLKDKFGNRKSGTKLLSGIKVKLINPINVIGGYNNSSFKSLNFQGRRAYYNASDKTIYINVAANYNNGNSSGVLLHELMHSLTVDRILSNSESKAKFEEILKDYQNSNFDSRYREGEEHKLEEFIANIWADPVTIENLKRIKSTRTSQSLWEEIKNFFNNIISKLFNGVSNDSLMAEASDELIKLLESPIIVQSKETFKENLSTPKKEIFYSEGEVNQLIKNLKEYEDYSDNDIKVQYFEGTEDLDEYWEVTYSKSSSASTQSTQNQPVAETPTQEETIEESTQSSNEEFAKESQSITEQINNLLDSNIILASEVRHIAEQIVYTISDIITECQTISGRMVELFGDRFKDFDAENATRVEIAKQIGPNDLIKFAKLRFKDFDSSNTEGNKASYKTLKKARLILQNWKALMYLATDVFANVESFTIVGNEVREDINANADNFNESNNQDDIGEVEGDTQEHWQIETKTLDVLSSMSQLVRQALLKCYLLETTSDSDGNVTYKKVKSKFNIDERVNPRDATNSILRWVQGSITLEDMITKLQTKVDSNPWVSQLIDRLTDTSGKESDFQSQFFGVFNKHFQSYSVVIKENGIYKSIIINEFPALREAYNSITTQYKIGEHPMFGLNGVNKKTFKEFKETYEELLPHRSKFENADLQEVSRLLAFAYNALGYYVNPEMVTSSLDSKTFKKMLDYMGYMIKSIESNIDNKNYDPFNFKAKGGISKNVREFLRPITDKLEDTAVSSFYDSGKMYQSYITPSYMTKLMNKFNLKGEEFDAFIMEEYGKYEWFKYKSRGIEKDWRNTWLELLATDGNTKEVFKHKVQLNFNKHNYMKNMSDTEYTLSLLTEYYSGTTDAEQSRVPAWFRVPMLSNKPSSEFIKFYSERGVNYKETITKGLKMIFDQELSRIQTVNMRAFNKKDARFIKNFEVNGKKFNFLDFMNDYLTGKSKDSELGKLIKSKVNGTRLTTEQETILNELSLKAIRESMDNKVKSVMKQWKDNGILEGAKQIENIGKEDSEVEEKLINFIWNDTFAAMNIIQLTVTDIAYYKDAEDLQKRLAQIHAPGVRAYVEAKDYAGNRVTDGYERTIYLKDFDNFKSNIIENVNIVFERKINSAKTEQEKSALIALKESLTKEPVYNEKGEEVEKGGAYWYINVADAQGFNSPTSYRKKAFVFGKWSKEAEEVYQNLKSGNYKYSDLQVAFQPLKPFVYSQIDKSSDVKDAPLSTLKVPVQNKNSEYLLVMADAILQGEDTGRPNLLRAIFEIMEESAEADNTKGIDTVQFESTVKSGLMGAIDINKFQYAEDGEAKAKAAMRAAIYANGESGEYNNSVVHKIPFEDYCLQQEVPAHFRNHEQAHGSQIRFIIPSDLEETNYLGEAVTYEVEGRQLTAEEFKSEYEDTIAANINNSIEILSNELHLTGSLKDRNIALSKILQREIIQSPRYGVDLLQACSVDENGNFRIPLGDPIQSKRVEQLINSIIKNRVNKQTIAGGPVVQVSNFGTSKELNIRFKSKEKDKNGNPLLLKTRKEFEGTDAQFKEYISENQAGIAYFEVFAPIYTNEIFTKFQNPDGSIDIEAIEALHPDLLKMVGYRIPTEDKYSMAPLKIVGFLPREAGEGIMMPNDITLLTGSDFDVKIY